MCCTLFLWSPHGFRNIIWTLLPHILGNIPFPEHSCISGAGVRVRDVVLWFGYHVLTRWNCCIKQTFQDILKWEKRTEDCCTKITQGWEINYFLLTTGETRWITTKGRWKCYSHSLNNGQVIMHQWNKHSIPSYDKSWIRCCFIYAF